MVLLFHLNDFGSVQLCSPFTTRDLALLPPFQLVRKFFMLRSQSEECASHPNAPFLYLHAVCSQLRLPSLNVLEPTVPTRALDACVTALL
jgi:hypothetical protein